MRVYRYPLLMFFIKGIVGYLVMRDEFDMLLPEAIVKALELRERA